MGKHDYRLVVWTAVVALQFTSYNLNSDEAEVEGDGAGGEHTRLPDLFIVLFMPAHIFKSTGHAESWKVSVVCCMCLCVRVGCVVCESEACKMLLMCLLQSCLYKDSKAVRGIFESFRRERDWNDGGESMVSGQLYVKTGAQVYVVTVVRVLDARVRRPR